MLSPLSHSKSPPLRLVLDEPVVYLKDNRGSVLVRGEAIVHFTKNTAIQGPIELIFEGIQRFHPWPGIMLHRPLGGSIETKLQVIELSLLPPNAQGVMPAGVHRFPFEFPIPASLPTSITIPDRLDIFYRLTARLQRSAQHAPSSDGAHWLDWTRWGVLNRPIVATADLRLVRAVECLPGLTPQGRPSLPPSLSEPTSDMQIMPVNTESDGSCERWRSCSLPRFTLDEQYDRLAYSMAGRAASSECRPSYEKDRLISYRLAVDRTAVALGTSIGIEVMIEPKASPVKIRAILLEITESRDYAMRIPGDHTIQGGAETRRLTENSKMVLKWAYGAKASPSSATASSTSSKKKTDPEQLLKPYLHRRSKSRCEQPLSPALNTSSMMVCRSNDPDLKTGSAYFAPLPDEDERGSSGGATGELMNLKLLNYPMAVDEYFQGRFTMPVPTCQNILHPSMDYDSVKVYHWLKLFVSVECEGKAVTVSLQTPIRILDCRLVAADDACQTLLPPPPSYHDGQETPHSLLESGCATFWEQRQAITMGAGWGTSPKCPCLLKRNAKVDKAPCPSMRPEWGPPPCYSSQ